MQIMLALNNNSGIRFDIVIEIHSSISKQDWIYSFPFLLAYGIKCMLSSYTLETKSQR